MMISTLHLSEEARTLIEEKRATRLPPPTERRNLRKSAGFSLREMAHALGIGTATAHRWEVAAGRLPRHRAEAYIALLAAWQDLAQEVNAVRPA